MVFVVDGRSVVLVSYSLPMVLLVEGYCVTLFAQPGFPVV